MNNNTAAAAQVVAVLLADGWHHVTRGSFSVGPLGLGAHADLGGLGFRFEEADTGSLHKPTSLAGPLDSIIAVRQVPAAAARLGDLDRARGSAQRSPWTKACGGEFAPGDEQRELRRAQ